MQDGSLSAPVPYFQVLKGLGTWILSSKLLNVSFHLTLVFTLALKLDQHWCFNSSAVLVPDLGVWTDFGTCCSTEVGRQDIHKLVSAIQLQVFILAGRHGDVTVYFTFCRTPLACELDLQVFVLVDADVSETSWNGGNL